MNTHTTPTNVASLPKWLPTWEVLMPTLSASAICIRTVVVLGRARCHKLENDHRSARENSPHTPVFSSKPHPTSNIHIELTIPSVPPESRGLIVLCGPHHDPHTEVYVPQVLTQTLKRLEVSVFFLHFTPSIKVHTLIVTAHRIMHIP